ncbi:CRISPR-associated endonuclease Cas1 [Methanomicrobium antiquum]|uniref:CRISPR-associated endonuclease Cas1 n=1 Tax=Methanomicrobium antiquum TaxID=487686 RepID=A0AAF0JL56_9EURY|nr:CRISPR-associated endonuclease Cas1 [Methanomicrobium antiquum]MDD3977505.1 CRISPR-associated endonuclease Cas1 [Methanomicrobium sp.]WFN36279.1 CRISPR-associated endonuclease Cas1 [Methanomicrobium antiquum]
MDDLDTPWKIVAGFGGHIKATKTTLVIQKKGVTKEYPLSEISHLLVAGGHNIHTSTISVLLKNQILISFFDADGTPLAVLRPYGCRLDEEMRALQIKAPGYAKASEIVRSSIKSRLLMIDKSANEMGKSLFYEGEAELIYNMLEDIDYLIKMDELRRIHKMAGDMYYEIMSRSISPVHKYRCRTERPHNDPVNAMLSLGYSMLFGNCCVPAIGANLDIDIGILREGKRALVLDLIDPLKAGMVDSVVFSIAREYLMPEKYECGNRRCHLEEDILDILTEELHKSISNKKIQENVLSYRNSIKSGKAFKINY